MKKSTFLLLAMLLISPYSVAESPDCLSGDLVEVELGLGDHPVGTATFSDKCAHKNTKAKWPRPARKSGSGWGQVIMCFPDLKQCHNNPPQDEAYLSFTIPKFKSVPKAIEHVETSYQKAKEENGISIYQRPTDTDIRYVSSGKKQFVVTCIQHQNSEFSSCEMIGLAPHEAQYFLKTHVDRGAADWASTHDKVSNFILRAVQLKR
ncbi:hypothetical protein [Alloalcanivorax balearicus]|uniref:hypothetical protein n=1 Tax=Alloalcanivorax balearicus TaxID=413232 RepID=UPI0021CDAEE4|nr:hypothetical protein [Alloalcanivorax balearicus]